MERIKDKKTIEIRENPSDIALKCLLYSFITIISTQIVMHGMANALFIEEIFIGVLLTTAFLLGYTYSKVFRGIGYGILLLVGFALIFFGIIGNNNAASTLIDSMAEGYMLSVLALIGISIYFYLFIVIFPKTLMCILLLTGIITGMLLMEYDFPIILFVLLVTALYVVFMLERNTKSYAKASIINRDMITKPTKATFKMFISYALLFVILTTTNISNNPLLGGSADNILKGIQLKIEGLFLGPEGSDGPISRTFSISSMGFGKSGELGGNVTLNNEAMLAVYGVERGFGNIYLGGVAYDVYSGRAWDFEDSYESFSLENELVIGERSFGLNSFYSKPQRERNDHDVSVYVKHEKALRTNSLFTFANTFNLDFSQFQNTDVVAPGEQNTKYVDVLIDKNEKYSQKRAITADEPYKVNAYEINETSFDFIEKINNSTRGLYKRRLAAGNSPEDATLNLLDQRSEDFYARYLQLPNNLPKRVYDLAKTLTTGLVSDYEKAKAIETYLSKNYSYTLKPGDVPKGYDFVDYFLFESKAGYCSYYATAMTILLRCVGVPTRYVEGFAVGNWERQGTSIYTVLASDAHAWPEVYFEGIGFIGFEPTSSFGEENEPEVSVEPSPEVTPTPTPTPIDSEEPTSSLLPSPSVAVSVAPTNAPDNDKGIRMTKAELYALLSVLVILTLFILVVVAMIIKRKLFILRVLNKEPSDSVIYVYRRIERLLGYFHLPRNQTFTLPEYESVLHENKVFNIPNMLYVYERATTLFNKARYSRKSVNHKDVQDMLLVYDDFVSAQKARLGLLKYFIYRYLLGKL